MATADENFSSESVGQRVLEARAAALSVPLDAGHSPAQQVELLTFGTGNERFAIGTEFVKEVVQEFQLTLLPGDTHPIVGITHRRGEFIAVATLTTVIVRHDDEDPGWLIVLGDDRIQFALIVQQVFEVIALPIDEILAPVSDLAPEIAELVGGVTKDAYTVLDGMALLRSSAFVVDQASV